MQALVNNLNWGLDDRIHGATSHSGGLVSRPGSEDKPLELRGRDFFFDPRDDSLLAENGGGQHGLSFDAFGRKFVCSNSNAVQTFMYDGRYAGRNPLFALPPPLVDVAAGSDVYRITPEESWRVLRTRLRVAGQVPGPIEGGGRASGYFTGVSGIAIYTGDALPAPFQGNAFIGEVANNLVHRRVIAADGVGVVARRADDEPHSEFVASKDIWFRPVQLANGPDGALYVVDMYREVIEHPWSLPDDIRSKLDLHSGRERGRIWRVVPDGFVARKPPHLSTATTAELAALLEHPNGWHRDTAARLLFQRQDPAATPLLAKLLEQSKSPVGRLRALCALQGQGALQASQVLAALRDPDAHVRQRAVLLSEDFIRGENCPAELWSVLQTLTDDPAIEVRYRLAFSLGEARQADRVAALARIARRDFADPWMQAAVMNSIAGHEAEMLGQMAAVPEVVGADSGREFLRQLASLIGRRGEKQGIDAVVSLIGGKLDPAFAFALATALREGLKESADAPMTDWLARARSAATDRAAGEAVRVEAVGLLGTTSFADSGTLLLPLLDAGEPQAVQLAAVGALDRFGDSRVGPELVRVFSSLSPQVRSAALAALLKRPDRATCLLEAIEAGKLRTSDVPSAQAGFLRRHADPAVRALAVKALPADARGREALIAAFQPALELSGDAARGRLIYQQRCSSCHRLGGEGFAIGPDLTTVRNDGKAKTLVNIIDPNREVAPNYVAFLVETRSGDSVVGVVTETASAVTVRQPFGKETTILRPDIRRIESQRLSLMPEGLEQGLKPQDFADLLEWVFTAPAPR